MAAPPHAPASRTFYPPHHAYTPQRPAQAGLSVLFNILLNTVIISYTVWASTVWVRLGWGGALGQCSQRRDACRMTHPLLWRGGGGLSVDRLPPLTHVLGRLLFYSSPLAGRDPGPRGGGGDAVGWPLMWQGWLLGGNPEVACLWGWWGYLNTVFIRTRSGRPPSGWG